MRQKLLMIEQVDSIPNRDITPLIANLESPISMGQRKGMAITTEIGENYNQLKASSLPSSKIVSIYTREVAVNSLCRICVVLIFYCRNSVGIANNKKECVVSTLCLF